jgi:hypothetical protein
VARKSGKALAKAHGIAVEHAFYRSTGDWYHILKAFRGALLDANGYLRFDTQEDCDAFVNQGTLHGVLQNRDTNTLTIRDGISCHEGYVYFSEQLLLLDEEHQTGVVREGARVAVRVNAYEQNSSARMRSIERWGQDCTVCGFNFERAYVELGAGFIYVHHLIPISSVGEEYELNPESDLRPVCANCHAMLHQEDPPISIAELRKRLLQT